MTDLLPPALTDRTTKGSFVNTDQQGIRRNQAALRELVASFALNDSGAMTVLTPRAQYCSTSRN